MNLERIGEKTKLAYSVEELAEMTSLSEGYFRYEIRLKKLRAKKFGTRVLVLAPDWQSYAESKEDWQPTSKR